ncbi:MAG: L-threonylcarbamoyladenylate synthase [Mariniphaga sp.]
MQEINQIVECLERGGVVLLPTDTVYGIAVKPNIESAVAQIYKLKSRPRNMFLPIMVSSIDYFEGLGLNISDNTNKLLNSNLVPGAITIALGFNPTKQRPSWLDGRDEVAIRIPNDERLLSVLRMIGPLLVTSANKHGSNSTPNNLIEILDELNGRPDLIIDGGIKQEIPSTIINCRLNPPVIEREGYISSVQIFNILDNG